MSAAGKFIPGGAARKSAASAGAPAPIRGPERPVGVDLPSAQPNRLLAKGAGLTKQVPKQQRLPILLMSSVVCCLIVSIAWYELGVKPVRRALAAEQAKEATEQQQLAAAQATATQKADVTTASKAPAPTGTVIVNSNPPGVATIGDVTKPTPATFDKVTAGKVSLVVQASGFNDYHEDLTVTANAPSNLGTIQLSQAMGTVVLSSPQTDVSYTLTGPGDYNHQGQMPDKLADLPAGTYQLAVHQDDWQLPPVPLVLHGQETLQKEVKFPYGGLSLTSIPTGATVRKGNVVLGQTPLTLSNLRPGQMDVSVDLAPYTTQRVSLTIPDSNTLSQSIVLQRGKDFIGACGMPMIWMAEGYWVGKYDMTQKSFEAVANYNPSSFRRPTRPVESVTWEQAMAFCDKLTQFEEQAGTLPKGYHYSLPSETQWDAYCADASMDMAATSRAATLSSTQDVGASEPNKFGLFDTIGNVWEWCLDPMDENGAHSMRGGSWLSSSVNFPNVETRTAGAAKYSDRFTGFRVVLVPRQ